MTRNRVLFGAVALTCTTLGAGAASAATPVTGNVSCTLSGHATLKPGLPTNSPGNATKPFKTKVKFTGTLSGCTGTQAGTKKGAQIDGGSVSAKGTIATAVGAPLPSCLGLATPPVTPSTLKTTIKFTSAGKKIAKSSLLATLGTASVGPPLSFPTAGPVLKGAFVGQTETANAVLDLDTVGLLGACGAAGGLTDLAFTGVSAPSTLVIP